jgi:hypothetical protein
MFIARFDVQFLLFNTAQIDWKLASLKFQPPGEGVV